jgi:HK97 family phage major capsid protein
MLEHHNAEQKPNPALTEALDEFMGAFEVFKETNDARLEELEKRGAPDVVTVEKLARIDQAIGQQQKLIDELALKGLRPQLHDGSPSPARGAPAHKSAFEGYVRKGDAHPLVRLESKALSVGSEADGGYLVPEETERGVNRALHALSPIRAISGARQVSASVYKRPFVVGGAGAGWVGESVVRPQTGTPGLAELNFPTMELYAMPAATSVLLDDGAVDIDEWLAEEVRIAFANQEGTAFVTGDGVNKPKGFLAYPTVANSSWTWGSLGTIATGAAGAFPTANPADKLIDLIYAVKAPYRANARFVMNRVTQSVVRKMKDGQGNYLWQPSAIAGAPSTLLGFPVTEAEEMPDIAASSMSIAFGDFKRGYLVVDRTGIRVLRDHYSMKPYVLFYTTKRVGGGVQDFEAIKLLKFAVS